MDRNEQLDDFIKDFCGAETLPAPGDDLFEKLQLDGDDCTEFFKAFSDRFGVDMSTFLWYFHHGEEGHNFGALFFKAPDQRVEPIPVTIDLLSAAISAGRWSVAYPPHTLPSRRWDMVINGCMGAAIAGFLAFTVIATVQEWTGLRP